MNIDLQKDHISLKESVSNAILQRNVRKSFKVHELDKMNKRMNRLSSMRMKTSNRSEQQIKLINGYQNDDSFQDRPMRSADRSQEFLQVYPQSICLKQIPLRQGVSHLAYSRSQVDKNTSENIPSIQKFRNLCNMRNPSKPLKQNPTQKQKKYQLLRKNPLYSKQRLSVCIESLNEFSRISERLARAQISVTQKLKTQQSRGVTILSTQIIETPQTRMLQMNRKKIVFDEKDVKNVLTNHLSFSPINFRVKNHLGPINLVKREKDYLFEESFGYLSVKGKRKSIEQKGKQAIHRKRSLLQKIQHHLLTVNSANSLQKRLS